MSFESAKREINREKRKEQMRSYEHSGKKFLDESRARARTMALEKAKKEYKGLKGEYSKTKQGNFMKVHPLDRE